MRDLSLLPCSLLAIILYTRALQRPTRAMEEFYLQETAPLLGNNSASARNCSSLPMTWRDDGVSHLMESLPFE
jgi:hypothetical protein